MSIITNMNFFAQFVAYWIRLPAELKGMKFGRNSFIAPGYDWISVYMKGITVKDNSLIGKNAWIQTVPGAFISIGNNTQIGRNVLISAQKNISIGDECLISYNVSILDHEHDYTNPHISPIKSGITKIREVVIEDQCFIGAHSFILKGVHLGKHCVVGANSVVTTSFPAYSMIAGSPAKLVGSLQE